MKIYTFGITLHRDTLMGYGRTAKGAEEMCHKAYKAITSTWDEEYAPRDWSKAKECFGIVAREELEIPCATYDHELIKKEAYE